jgi:hypothetical protein
MARSSAVVIHWQVREASLKAIKLGDVPSCSGPRVSDGVGRFKAGSIGAVSLVIAFDPIVFFCNPVVVEDDGVSPEEVLEVKRASSDLATVV